MRRQPGLRQRVAVLHLTRHCDLVIGDADAGLALDAGVEGDAAVDAELAGMEGHRQHIGVVADLADEIFDRILADSQAARGDDDAGYDLAAPGGDRNPRRIRRRHARADRTAREGQHEDRIDLLHRERTHRRIRLIGAGLRVDDLDVPAGRLRALRHAGDHRDVESVVGDQRDDPEGLRLGAGERRNEQPGGRRQHRQRGGQSSFHLRFPC